MEKEIQTLKEHFSDTKQLENFYCDICEYKASSVTVLKRHKTMKHKDQNKLKESAGPSLESASSFSTHPASPSTSLAATLASDTSLQHSVPCCRAFYDCKNMVANYLDPHTALCPDCKLKLDESFPFFSNLVSLLP